MQRERKDKGGLETAMNVYLTEVLGEVYISRQREGVA